MYCALFIIALIAQRWNCFQETEFIDYSYRTLQLMISACGSRYTCVRSTEKQKFNTCSINRFQKVANIYYLELIFTCLCVFLLLFFIRFLGCLFANRTHVLKNLRDFHLFFMYNCSPSLSPRKEEKQRKKENTSNRKAGR